MSDVVLVRFEKFGGFSGRAYSYFTDIELEVGDIVVIDGAGVLKTGEVSKVKKIPIERRELANKWVVQKVDDKLVKEASRKRKKFTKG